jgi:hypothetical protein
MADVGIRTAIIIIATAISFWSAVFAGWACSSGEEFPGSFEDDVCGSVGRGYTASWWLAVLWPAIVFGVSLAVPPLRAHAVPWGIGVGLLAVAFWVVVGAIVIDVGEPERDSRLPEEHWRHPVYAPRSMIQSNGQRGIPGLRGSACEGRVAWQSQAA